MGFFFRKISHNLGLPSVGFSPASPDIVRHGQTRGSLLVIDGLWRDTLTKTFDEVAPMDQYEVMICGRLILVFFFFRVDALRLLCAVEGA